MSVTGFTSNGQVHRYDYNALDNRPPADGSGLTAPMKDALLQLAQKVWYRDEHGQTYYQDLYDAFYSTFYSVASSVENCTISNSKSYAKAGARYTATLSATPGYTLTGATVAITMGGTNITSTAYSNGTINIANVTGNIGITVVAISAVSTLTATYTPSGTVYAGGVLDDLIDDLVVTAVYTDSTTGEVPATDYTLSGELSTGASTITVAYGGKTTTFNVAVEANGIVPGTYSNGTGSSITVEESNVNYNAVGSTSSKFVVIPLKGKVSVHKGDVVTFSGTNASPGSVSRENSVKLSGSASHVSFDPFTNSSVSKSVTMTADLTTSAIEMRPSYVTNVAWTLSIAINGEVIL